MDACQFFIKSSRLSRFYLLSIYSIAIVALVSRYAINPSLLLPVTALLVLLLILCYRDWRQQFLTPLKTLNGMRFQQGRWSVLITSQWQPVTTLFCDYRMPWLISLSVIDYPTNKLHRYVIWRDSLSAQQWRLLLVYLSL